MVIPNISPFINQIKMILENILFHIIYKLLDNLKNFSSMLNIMFVQNIQEDPSCVKKKLVHQI